MNTIMPTESRDKPDARGAWLEYERLKKEAAALATSADDYERRVARVAQGVGV